MIAKYLSVFASSLLLSMLKLFIWGGGGRWGGGGCRDDAVVRALASHLCGLGSIPRLGVICGLSLLVLYSESFSPGTPVFPSPKKTKFDLHRLLISIYSAPD